MWPRSLHFVLLALHFLVGLAFFFLPFSFSVSFFLSFAPNQNRSANTAPRGQARHARLLGSMRSVQMQASAPMNDDVLRKSRDSSSGHGNMGRM